MRHCVFLLAVLICFSGCSDIRTNLVKKEVNRYKGVQLLRKMGEAHQISTWDSVATYSVYFQEHFYGKIGQMANPFPDEITKMELDYIPGTFNGRITFLSGEWQSQVWGVSEGATYEKVTLLDSTEFVKNKDAAFWVPTYQYFIEFPARIQEATAVGYAGQKEVNQQICEGIMVSWGTLEPQRKVDQYLIWVNQTTHQIVKIEYTIRELNSLLKGAVYFKDYATINGLLIPTRMPVESNLVRNGMLHEMRLDSIQFDIIPQAALRPTPVSVEKSN
jgi:hypothetical protein